ncbi:MAG TPA: 23S rRNA (guanosine(2251)-2'-O)-methyltransferase RlmB [Candidatus Limnocylindrales bacterium]|nr:23S rRNA (guanosine(2251)-2'-O)-methyltransferase RlmB [Candidatus Limnocylindrales bacterium]
MDTAGLLEEDAELVAGRRPVEEAFAARREARRLLVVPQRRAALEALVLHATTLRIPVVEVEGGTLTSLAGFDGHQGVALVTGPRRWATLDEVIARAMERGERPFLVALDSLEDPQNMGTLLRAAEAAGVHGVVFPTRRSAPLSPAAVKASAGAVEHLLLVPVDDLPATLAQLHGRGLRLVGAEAEAPLGYREADMRGPIVLVVGSEGHGLSAAIRRRLDLLVRIPMAGRVASLNAAVAGAILLFEAAGQRGTPERAQPPERAPSPEPDQPPEPTPSASDEPTTADASVEPAKPARKRATRSRPATEPPAAETPPTSEEKATAQAPEAAELDLLPGEPAEPSES